jgi:hypothetical protein
LRKHTHSSPTPPVRNTSANAPAIGDGRKPIFAAFTSHRLAQVRFMALPIEARNSGADMLAMRASSEGDSEPADSRSGVME